MRKYLVILMTIVLFAFRSVSSNIEMNDKQETDSSKTPQSETNDNTFRRMVNNLPGIQLGRMGKNYNREDIEALRQVIQDAPHLNWQQFTAPPVEEPNCFVEFQITQKMPGKCTKLKGGIPACQTQNLVQIDYNSCK